MEKSVDYPDFIARFYDAIYSKVRSGIDDDFFLQEMAATKGKVLELGVGTGRFFTTALKNGADVYGIDVSKSMVDKLREKISPEQQHRVQVNDAVTMKLPLKFGLVIAPFRMFSHVIDVASQLQLLNNIYDHLEADGRFIFDLYVPNLLMLANGIDHQTDFEGEYEKGKKLKRVSTMKADLINQLSSVTMELTWDENGQVMSRSWDFLMRFFFRYELEHLVNRSKLKLETIYGDYHKSPLTKDSKDFVVVCKK